MQSMPIHVLQCDSSCRVLPVKALEDPVLEKRVHGYRHNGNKRIDGCFLQHSSCNQGISITSMESNSAPSQIFYACIAKDRCCSQQKALILATVEWVKGIFSGRVLLCEVMHLAHLTVLTKLSHQQVQRDSQEDEQLLTSTSEP